MLAWTLTVARDKRGRLEKNSTGSCRHRHRYSSRRVVDIDACSILFLRVIVSEVHPLTKYDIISDYIHAHDGSRCRERRLIPPVVVGEKNQCH
jgi:hypothetical protein